MKNFLLSAILASALAAPAAQAITIDGDLSDWGVIVANNNGSNFSGVTGVLGYQSSMVEDQGDTNGHSSAVTPFYGGQDYDAEFIAVALQGTTLYVAIVSGQRPDNGAAYYGPGDVRIQGKANGVDTFKYGIEVGGGLGGSTGTPLTEGSAGTTYVLAGNGTTSSVSGTHSALQTTGSIWRGVDWIPTPLANTVGTGTGGLTPNQLGFFYANTQFKVNGGSTQVGSADFINMRNATAGPNQDQHSVIEFAIADVYNVFDGSDHLEIYWGPSCGNDIVLTVAVGEPEVPLPGTLALALAGFAGLGWTRRRA